MLVPRLCLTTPASQSYEPLGAKLKRSKPDQKESKRWHCDLIRMLCLRCHWRSELDTKNCPGPRAAHSCALAMHGQILPVLISSIWVHSSSFKFIQVHSCSFGLFAWFISASGSTRFTRCWIPSTSDESRWHHRWSWRSQPTESMETKSDMLDVKNI